MNLVMIGPPGSGKSSQARLLAEKLGLVYISTGDITRALNEQGTTDGRQAYGYLLRGEWVPDSLITKMLKTWINQQGEVSGVILDGYPRTLKQVPQLETGILPGDGTVTRAIYVNTNEDACLERLAKRAKIEHRADETPEAIKNRLREYNEKTKPILDYYRQKGILIEVDGNPSIEQIHQEILSKVTGIPT